jgi:hypothetical protein
MRFRLIQVSLYEHFSAGGEKKKERRKTKRIVRRHCKYILVYVDCRPWLRYLGNEIDCCLEHTTVVRWLYKLGHAREAQQFGPLSTCIVIFLTARPVLFYCADGFRKLLKLNRHRYSCFQLHLQFALCGPIYRTPLFGGGGGTYNIHSVPAYKGYTGTCGTVGG